MTDYTELKRLAEAANAVTGDVSVEMTLASESGPNQEEIDAVTAFMGAAKPATVLALIADLDEARNGMKYSCAIRLKKEIERLEGEAMYAAAGFDAARQEIATLRAEIAGLKTGYEAYEQVNAELKAECEALREEIGGIKEVSSVQVKALKALTFAARTTGGTAGPDEGLMKACEEAERSISLGGIGRAYMVGADAAMGKGERS